jgi:hypothetical protein
MSLDYIEFLDSEYSAIIWDDEASLYNNIHQFVTSWHRFNLPDDRRHPRYPNPPHIKAAEHCHDALVRVQGAVGCLRLELPGTELARAYIFSQSVVFISETRCITSSHMVRSISNLPESNSKLVEDIKQGTHKVTQVDWAPCMYTSANFL